MESRVSDSGDSRSSAGKKGKRLNSFKMAIAGGGTGGHVLPVIAVLEELDSRGIETDLLWIGSREGLEGEVAAQYGIPFRSISTGKLRRYVDWRTIPDGIRIPVGTMQALHILRGFKPDIVFSSGGFVSVPSVTASRISRYPVLTHEQTASFGLANQINARLSTVMAFSFESSMALAEGKTRQSVLTGNPVRTSLLNGDADRARSMLNLDRDLPMIYVTGGARGASPINLRLEAALPILLQHCQVIHQTGPDDTNADYSRLRRMSNELPSPLRERYRVFEYIGDELSDIYAAADLVISRAGAGSVAELALLQIPSILIPLPGSGGGEQWANARVLEQVGAAVVIDENDATPERLIQEVESLLGNPELLRTMTTAAGTAGRPAATADLADTLLTLARQSRPD